MLSSPWLGGTRELLPYTLATADIACQVQLLDSHIKHRRSVISGSVCKHQKSVCQSCIGLIRWHFLSQIGVAIALFLESKHLRDWAKQFQQWVKFVLRDFVKSCFVSNPLIRSVYGHQVKLEQTKTDVRTGLTLTATLSTTTHTLLWVLTFYYNQLMIMTFKN